MTSMPCPNCPDGKLVLKIIPIFNTHFGGIPVQIPNAEIFECTSCRETTVSATELERWEQIQRDQLREDQHTPSPESVKRLRKALGLSVADFAALLAVTRQTVYAWERNDTKPMNVGPAALLIKLLDEEVAGNLEGIFATLRRAAEKREQNLSPAVLQRSEK